MLNILRMTDGRRAGRWRRMSDGWWVVMRKCRRAGRGGRWRRGFVAGPDPVGVTRDGRAVGVQEGPLRGPQGRRRRRAVGVQAAVRAAGSGDVPAARPPVRSAPEPLRVGAWWCPPDGPGGGVADEVCRRPVSSSRAPVTKGPAARARVRAPGGRSWSFQFTVRSPSHAQSELGAKPP